MISGKFGLITMAVLLFYCSSRRSRPGNLTRSPHLRGGNSSWPRVLLDGRPRWQDDRERVESNVNFSFSDIWESLDIGSCTRGRLEG